MRGFQPRRSFLTAPVSLLMQGGVFVMCDNDPKSEVIQNLPAPIVRNPSRFWYRISSVCVAPRVMPVVVEKASMRWIGGLSIN